MNFDRRGTQAPGRFRAPPNILIPPNSMSYCQVATATQLQTDEMCVPQTSSTPAIVQTLETLEKFLVPPPADASHIQVIAVDGLDRLIVGELLKHLKSYIEREDPQSNITVYSELPFHWNALWNHSKGTADRSQRNIAIVGYAPLMALQKASASWRVHDPYAEHQNWEYRADAWRGQIRPDITIIAQQYDGKLDWPTVLAVHECRSLMVPRIEEGKALCGLQLDLLQCYVKHWLNLGTSCDCFRGSSNRPGKRAN